MKPLDWVLKLLRIVLLTLAFSVAILIGLLDYLLTTQGGSESLARLVENTFPEIKIEQVSGSVLKGLKLEKLQVSPWVEIHKLQLKINPRCVLKA
ncbi:MAG TPA: hypothetical protein VFM46_03155, partial [Pseudomonadales bacterium]|nr:hypothetical protein [Pseudomonadales bacterium]